MSVTSEDKIARIASSWRKAGASVTSVARDCGVAPHTARKFKPAVSPVAAGIKPFSLPAQAVAEMAHAFERGDDFEEPPERQWKREEFRSGISIRRAKETAQFTFQAPGPHLMVAIISDMHIAPGTPVDFKRMREDAELIRDTPGLYCVLAGDQVDNHIKHRSAMLAARSQPEDQYKLFEYYLGIIGPKCLVVTSGNHDDWTSQYAGVDVLGRIVRDHRVFYSPDEAWIDINVAGQKYVLAVRHQYRFGSQFNQTHTVKQWLRLGPRDFDVGVIGHHHEAALEQTIWRDQFRWVARPGSYQITSSYARQLGFNLSVPTCPTFLFHGDQHEVTAWKSVGAMARSQAALQQLRAA